MIWVFQSIFMEHMEGMSPPWSIVSVLVLVSEQGAIVVAIRSI